MLKVSFGHHFWGIMCKECLWPRKNNKNIAFVAKERYFDCNWTRTQNHLVLKRTLNHLAKLIERSFKN